MIFCQGMTTIGSACHLWIGETSSFIALVMGWDLLLEIRASYYGGRHEC